MIGRFSVHTVFRGVIVLTAACVLCVTATAQDSPPEYPTLAALEAGEPPALDRIDAARRLRGVTEIRIPENPPARQIGERDRFWVANQSDGTNRQIDADLYRVGDHAYFWVQAGAQPDLAVIDAIAQRFDDQVYNQVRALWGSEPIPGVDGDPRLHVLFASDIGLGVGAYYSSQHSQPPEVVEQGNGREMMTVSLAFISPENIDLVESILAHEFQHMIRKHLDANEDAWLDEGLSVFTQQAVTGLGASGYAESFFALPNVQLNTWAVDFTRQAHYGAGFTFVTYLYERLGADTLRAMSDDPANGLRAIDNAVRAAAPDDYPLGVDSLFADWALANILRDPALDDGRYGYESVQAATIPAFRAVYSQYPAEFRSDLAQYAVDYVLLNELAGARTLDLALELPAIVPLIPTDPFSGDWMWYSQRGDNIDSTLTRAFDLRDVETATLEYQAWYQIERGWDYAYVMISDDGGARWDLLPAPGMTDENPLGYAYGLGYSGDSGGWITQRVSLDAYAGREVLIRFELITDDALNLPGLAIDDVAIAAIDYFSDFEADSDGWEADGWVRIDNVLPQRAWVQVAQITAAGELSLTRLLAEPGSGGPWRVNLAPGVDRALIAVSPFAPVTTVGVSYDLWIAPAE
jgi:hypothetical protein